MKYVKIGSIFLWLTFLLPFIVNGQTGQHYAMPVADTVRLAKIKALLPAIDNIYKQYSARNKFPSISYGVLLDGKLISSGSLGMIQVDKKIKPDNTSMYRVASMSKSVTAVSILQLRDAGKLSLDDPASKYIPELKLDKLLTTDAPVITIRHLLNHAAGFPEDNPWGDRQLEDSNADLINLIKKGTYFSNVPGVAYEYSNLGFALLGQIVEKVSGIPLEVYTKEKIFKPLGMSHSEWEYTKVPADKLAHGYRLVNGEWKEETPLHHGSYGAMGGLITSIEDFSKYIAMHMAAWPPRSGPENPVLKRSSLREMHMPSNFSGFNPLNRYPNGKLCPTVSAYNYGLGWTRDCEDKIFVGHSGGLPGYGSQWRFLPEYGIGVVAFANQTYANLGTVNTQALDSLVRGGGLKPYALPVSEILNQRQDALIKLLPKWDSTMLVRYTAPATNIFSENFFPDYPLTELRTTHTNIFKAIGTIQNIGDVRPENQLRGTFEIVGDKGKLNVFFTLTPENPPLIQELRVTVAK
ncbi:MAG: serine hydrolase domain-containing protein [Saprospiraceae bacterium]